MQGKLTIVSQAFRSSSSSADVMGLEGFGGLSCRGSSTESSNKLLIICLNFIALASTAPLGKALE
jgi:hypothetical protein